MPVILKYQLYLYLPIYTAYLFPRLGMTQIYYNLWQFLKKSKCGLSGSCMGPSITENYCLNTVKTAKGEEDCNNSILV